MVAARMFFFVFFGLSFLFLFCFSAAVRDIFFYFGVSDGYFGVFDMFLHARGFCSECDFFGGVGVVRGK